ncbi:MAG: hypothetical protein P8078_05805, partial [bacterium]
MKRIIAYVNLIFSISLLFSYCTQQDGFPVLEGPYLGQKPPGLTPMRFAPGIITTNGYEGCSGFISNGTVFVFNRSAHSDSNLTYIPIYNMELKNGKWTKPYPSNFQNKHNDDNFTVAPDGQTLYFQSNRSIDGLGGLSQYSNIWKTIKTTDGWTQPVYVKTEDNGPFMGGYPSITKDGTLYFMSSLREGFGDVDIYRSRLVNGRYQKADNLGNVINSKYRDLDSFIAPDESYLIFCSNRPGGKGEYDLYISFRKKDGSWAKPINMGKEINSEKSVTRPSVTPDGKYF